MVYTIKINDSSKNAKALLGYLKTLDFIDIEVNEKDDFVLTDEHLEILNERREKHLKGESKSYSWEEVIENARKSK